MSYHSAIMLNRRAFILFSVCAVAACGKRPTNVIASRTDPFDPPLYSGETAEMRVLVNKWADHYGVPRSLFHRVIQRESDYNAAARNGPYYGLMQILPATAHTMGHRGSASELLDAETNLQYAGKYLRGAWLVSGGDEDEAIGWFARGYYYEAKRLGLLQETGLRA